MQRLAPSRSDPAAPFEWPAGPNAANGRDGATDHDRRQLRRQQLQFLCRQATRSPVAIAVVALFVGYVAWSEGTASRVMLWAALLAAVVLGRFAYARRVIGVPPAEADRSLAIMTGFATASGVVTGLAAILFFPSAAHVDQVLLTMLLVCWSAAGVSTAAAFAPAFYAFVVPALAPLATLWLATGTFEGAYVGFLVVFSALLQVFFVMDNQKLVRESFMVRFENERLIRELDRERSEVAFARDRAEDANRAKSRFLAAASHDLRQPLHAMSLFATALRLRTREPESMQIAERMTSAMRSLSALLDALLDISKLDAGAITPDLKLVDLKELVARLGAEYLPVARSQGIDLSTSTTSAVVSTDPVLFERVLRNLLDNALKYTQAGKIGIDVERTENAVRVCVRDTGRGIPEEELVRVFEEFYQIGNSERDRTRGLGLGLAIVRRIARLLDIKVSVDSAVGVGSTFTLTLAPARVAASPAAREEATAVEDGVMEGAHVLVIDDEAEVRTAMAALLESWGCRVSASDGLDSALEQVADTGEDVDLIVADFRLRNGANGVEVVRSLRARLGDRPAILVSGDTSPERLREARSCGLHLLHKPVEPERLRSAMVAAMAR